jgi:hypothetical protein
MTGLQTIYAVILDTISDIKTLLKVSAISCLMTAMHAYVIIIAVPINVNVRHVFRTPIFCTMVFRLETQATTVRELSMKIKAKSHPFLTP